MQIEALAKQNMDALKANVYPGRGIVIGQTPDEKHMVQVYWIMGRSENSRNRIFVEEGDTVRTAPFDASKVEDPSLIIYNCARVLGKKYIVTNGDQTDTVYDGIEAGGTFESALYTREFEPDAPNYTPRISAVIDFEDPHIYKLGILKTIGNDPARPAGNIYNFGKAIPGIGHFIATYKGDGDPLPSFEGEPQPVGIPCELDATVDLYWSMLNEDNRVSMLVRFIDINSGETCTKIVNKHE